MSPAPNPVDQAREQLERLWQSLKPKVTTLGADFGGWRTKLDALKQDAHKTLPEVEKWLPKVDSELNAVVIEYGKLMAKEQRAQSKHYLERVAALKASCKERQKTVQGLRDRTAQLKGDATALDARFRNLWRDVLAKPGLRAHPEWPKLADLERKAKETGQTGGATLQRLADDFSKVFGKLGDILKKISETQGKMIKNLK